MRRRLRRLMAARHGSLRKSRSHQWFLGLRGKLSLSPLQRKFRNGPNGFYDYDFKIEVLVVHLAYVY